MFFNFFGLAEVYEIIKCAVTFVSCSVTSPWTLDPISSRSRIVARRH